MGKTAKIIYAGGALLLTAIFTSVFVNNLPGKPDPVIAAQPDVAMASTYASANLDQQPVTSRVEGGKIIISLNSVLDKKIVAFDYPSENTIIPLLAYISNDGKLVTCIRLCEPCNSHVFRIEGTELACGNCETHWKLSNLEGTKGSCQKFPPAPIPSVVVGSEIQIDEAVVKNWKMRI